MQYVIVPLACALPSVNMGTICVHTSPDSMDSSTKQLPRNRTMSQVALPWSTTMTSPGTSLRDDAALHSRSQDHGSYVQSRQQTCDLYVLHMYMSTQS